MNEKDEIAKAMAKMEAEAVKIEAVKNRERERVKQKPVQVQEKNRLKEIEEDNKKQHQEMVEKLKFKTIFIGISCLVTLIYVASLSPAKRALLVEDVIFWSLAAGMVIVAMLKK